MITRSLFACVGLLLVLLNASSVQSHQQRNYVDLITSIGDSTKVLTRNEDHEVETDILKHIQPATEEQVLDYAQLIAESFKNNQLHSSVLGAALEHNVSLQCINDSIYFLTGLIERQSWALQMFDAFGKPSSGLKQFELNWVGGYEECISVRAPVETLNPDSPSEDIEFKGQYCTAFLPLQPEQAGGPALPMPTVGVSLGICLPNSCSTADMVTLLNQVVGMINVTQLASLRFSSISSHCQNEDLEYDTKAIAAIVVGAIFAFLLALGTAYDFMYIQIPKWSQIKADDEYSAVNSSAGGGEEGSMNIKHRQDEQTPLIGDGKGIVEKVPEPGMCGKILLSFSVYSNGLKILSTKQPKGSLRCIHGIRFFSMTWVILGHTLVFGIQAVGDLMSYLLPLLKRFTFQAISNATVSVDTFFTISGLLVAYLTLKELKKTDGKLNWFMFYFHRYWRLTPPYMLLMLIYVPLFPYISNGPLWPQKGVEINQCSDTWWTNLLYINNLVKTKEGCMAWSWYLANDMQFYILSPLIILPLFYSRKVGIAVAMVFLLTTTITAGAVSSAYNMAPGIAAQPMQTGGGSAGNSSNSTTASSGQMDFFLYYYIAPYCRMGPYIVGLLAGYYLYVTELRIKFNKVTVVLGWGISTASALAVVYGLYDVAQGHPLSVATSAFYNAVNRSVWGACVCWVIIACVGGYGGPVNALLSWKALIPLSRLTYCAYLIHPIIMYAVYFSQTKPIYFTDSLYVYDFFGSLVAAYLLAFVLSLTFESPMMGLESAIFKRKKK